MSGRVLISVTGSPRTIRSSGSSAPARRRNVFNTLNTSLLLEKCCGLARGSELLREERAVHVLEHDADECWLFVGGHVVVVVIRDRFANRQHARTCFLEINATFVQHLCGDSLALDEHSEKEMLRADEGMI